MEFTVDCSNIFTRPWLGTATYLHAAGEWVENVCAENIREYYSSHDTQVPQAIRWVFSRRRRLVRSRPVQIQPVTVNDRV